MSSEAEENKAIVRRFLEAHAKGDLGMMKEMMAPDFVDHSTGKEYEVPSITIHRIVEGKIAEEWSQGGGFAELTQQRLELRDT